MTVEALADGTDPLVGCERELGSRRLVTVSQAEDTKHMSLADSRCRIDSLRHRAWIVGFFSHEWTLKAIIF